MKAYPTLLLTVRYQGFVLDDSDASLDARPKVSTPADATSPDGTYPILVRGAADQDYTIEHVDGTLTVSPEGRMHGTGVVEAPDARHRIDFNVRETIVLGEKGSLRLEIERKKGGDDKFVSQLVTDVVFRDIPGVSPGGKAEADSVTFVGIGRWNGQPATFEAIATDTGEPGKESDTITIKIFVGRKNGEHDQRAPQERQHSIQPAAAPVARGHDADPCTLRSGDCRLRRPRSAPCMGRAQPCRTPAR